VIHARHVGYYLYYCRFDVRYLQQVVKYGLDAGEHLERLNVPKARLLRSKPYNICVTSERVGFFKLFAYLLFYLSSGQAEIRYLAKNEKNPLWQVTSAFQFFF